MWMFCGRTLNRRINRFHERELGIAYEDYESSFEDLLSKDGSVMIHQRNLRVLAVEMYNIKDYNENNETVYTKKSNQYQICKCL